MRTTRGLRGVITVASLTLGLAAPALALDSISLSNGPAVAAKAAAENPCPPLTRIKYPFLTCSLGEGGGAVLDSLGRSGLVRLMPRQNEFSEGNGYYGPDRPL